MTDPIMKKAAGDGVAIQTARWPGKGRQVLCIHGLTANCRAFDRLAHGLTPAHTVVAVDLRGRGLSEKPATGYAIDRHVADIRCLMQSLGMDRVVLMGHSLGAYIALAAAAAYPERVSGLILLDGGAPLSADRWDHVEAAIQPSIDRLGRIFPSFADYTAPLKQVPFLQPWTAYMDAYYTYDTESLPEGVRARTPPEPVREEIANVRRAEAAVWYRRIRCPVLILRAPNGLISPEDLLLPEPAVDQMQRALPHAHRVDIPAANHFSIIFGDHPDRDRALLSFLDGLS